MTYKVLATLEESHACDTCKEVIPEGELAWVGQEHGMKWAQECVCIRCYVVKYGLTHPDSKDYDQVIFWIPKQTKDK